MPWVSPTNVATGDVLTASKWNQDVVANSIALPRGIIGYDSRTSNQTGITTVTTILDSSGGNLEVTWTAESSRYYRTTLYLPYIEQVTANAYPEIFITDGSNVAKQSALSYLLVGHGDQVVVVSVETGLSGSTTRRGRAATGGGSLTLAAGSARPIFIMVEDIGAV